MHLWSVSVSIHDKLMHSIRRAPQHPTPIGWRRSGNFNSLYAF